MSTPNAKTTHLCSGDSVVPRPSENVRPWRQGSCPVDVGNSPDSFLVQPCEVVSGFIREWW